tara:strand:- start:1373 stop:2092 length:720 start_codon:yes stop_codon:yes gene_type:complete
MKKNFDLSYYGKIIDEFKSKNYSFIFFNKKIKKKNILLRHDVDFSLEDALIIAKFEYKKKIRSNYFFLLSSPFYNILNYKDNLIVKKIKKLGHYVGVHFDPSIYKINKSKALHKEMKIFNDTINVQSKVFSLHRPGKLIKYKFGINLINTYDNKYFKKIKYISDSGGSFKYSYPLDWLKLNKDEPIQLLLHPIWWSSTGTTRFKVKKMLANKKEKIKVNILANFSKKNLKKNFKNFNDF